MSGNKPTRIVGSNPTRIVGSNPTRIVGSYPTLEVVNIEIKMYPYYFLLAVSRGANPVSSLQLLVKFDKLSG